jgi:hypothetical protein
MRSTAFRLYVILLGLVSVVCGMGLFLHPKDLVGNVLNPSWAEWQVQELGAFFVVSGATIAALSLRALIRDRNQS